MGDLLGRCLPRATVEALVMRMARADPQPLLEAVGWRLARERVVRDMPFDLPVGRRVEFEDLAGLFASTPLDHGVIAMTVRQAAYLFGLVRRMNARRVIEIGRYKGGSTLLIAAAMSGEGQFWSIDIGEKTTRLYPDRSAGAFDRDLAELCRRFGLKAELVVGDSRMVELETGEVDLVLIDGDHSYDGVRIDFERFGRRVRVGGAVLFDDAFDEGLFRTHSDTVGRLVQEISDGSEFKLVKAVNRLAHLERVAGSRRS